MIKFIQCVTRKPELDLAEFRRHWQVYLDEVKVLAKELGAVRVTFSTALAVQQNVDIALARGTTQPFDGVAEMWMDSPTEILAAVEKPDVAAKLDALREHQAEFVDLEKSSFFFASEEVVWDLSSETEKQEE